MTRMRLKVLDYTYYASILQIGPLRWEWVVSDHLGIVDNGVTFTRKGALREVVEAAQQAAHESKQEELRPW